MMQVEHGNAARPPVNKTSSEKILEVKAHIDCFPRVESHYCRKKTKKLYLAPDLSVSLMFSLYKKWVSNNPVSEKIYRQVFNSYDPPLGMFMPRKDQCTLCLRYKEDPDAVKDIWSAHKAREYASLELKEIEFGLKDAVRTITMDLQSILTLPYAANSELYYKRKLSLYNFTIYDDLANGLCYLWDEVNGKKGCNEIATCLINYISQLPKNVKKLNTWSDTCSAQNRNQYLLAAMIYAVNSPDTNVDVIDMKYLESGHSLMQCDSMHSLIERKRGKKRIFTTAEYRMIMEEARMDPRPYEVNVLNYTEFFDFTSFSKEVVANHNVDVNGAAVQYLRVKMFRFQRGSDRVLYSYDYNFQNFKEIAFLERPIPKRKPKNPQPSASGLVIPSLAAGQLRPSQLYFARLCISKPKKKDLLELIRKGVIPQYYADFYSSINASDAVKDTFAYVKQKEQAEIELEVIYGL